MRLNVSWTIVGVRVLRYLQPGLILLCLYPKDSVCISVVHETHARRGSASCYSRKLGIFLEES